MEIMLTIAENIKVGIAFFNHQMGVLSKISAYYKYIQFVDMNRSNLISLIISIITFSHATQPHEIYILVSALVWKDVMSSKALMVQ